jgi:hypothetical protein
MLSAGGLDPATTAVVVLGASEWPAAKQFEPAIQFANSARKFIEFLLAPNGFNLDRQNLLDLFDTEDEQPVIVRKIDDFLASTIVKLEQSGQSLTDVITFYVGHGGFDTGSNGAYFLSIRKTNPIDYLGSSLSASSLRRALREHARTARHYLILDCCFAAAAVAPYIQMSATAQAAVAQVQESFPSSGTALLCAAGASVPARAKRKATYTMFSEGLLDILNMGAPNAPEWLSITDLADAIRGLLRARYADEAVRPEVHCPEQPKGSVTGVPLFRNPTAFIQRVHNDALPIADVVGQTREQQISTAEQFFHEFQVIDIPPRKFGFTTQQWIIIPEPVKYLVKRFEEMTSDYHLCFVITSGVSIYCSISLFIIVRVYRPVSDALLFSIFGIGALVTVTVMVWTIYWLIIFLKSTKRVDSRVLRQIVPESEEWEKLSVMETLRWPKRILTTRSGKIYLSHRVTLRLMVGAVTVFLNAFIVLLLNITT